MLVRDGPRLRVFLNGTVEPEIDGEIELTAPGVSDYFFGTRSDRFEGVGRLPNSGFARDGDAGAHTG